MPHVEGREKGWVLLVVRAVVRVRLRRHKSAVRRIMVTMVRGFTWGDGGGRAMS